MVDSAEDVVHSAPVRAVGRGGLVAYGVVHLLIAFLAARIAFGDAEQADKTGALGPSRPRAPASYCSG